MVVERESEDILEEGELMKCQSGKRDAWDTTTQE